jgi:hypothetical protein
MDFFYILIKLLVNIGIEKIVQ